MVWMHQEYQIWLLEVLNKEKIPDEQESDRESKYGQSTLSKNVLKFSNHHECSSLQGEKHPYPCSHDFIFVLALSIQEHLWAS